MNQYDFNKLMEKYLGGECTQEEEQFVSDWSQQFSQFSSFNLSPREEQEIKKRNWKKLEECLPKTASLHSAFLRVMAVAALLGGLLIGARYLLYKINSDDPVPIEKNSGTYAYVSFINTEQKTRYLKLFDETIVELKPNSSLKYPSRFVGTQRNVYLTGEAFFKVKRDEKRPFFVHAGGLITEVLGTSFSVRSLTNMVEVSVVSGKVSVYENGSIKAKSQLILTPNHKATFTIRDHLLVPGIVEIPTEINMSQDQNKMIFDDVPLQKVAEELGKRFGLTITVQNEMIRNCLFSGDLNDLPLAEQLDLICKAVNARHTTIKNTIIIEGGDPCL